MAVKKGFWLAIGIAGIVIGPAIYGTLAKNAEIDELQKQRRLAREAGLPITAASLRPSSPIPDDQNAAPIIQRVHGMLFPQTDEKRVPELAEARAFFESRRTWARILAEPEEAERQLQAFAEPLKLMVDASRLPYCDYNRPWENGPAVTLPEFPTLRICIRAICLSAWLESGRGDATEALEKLTAAGRLCDLMRQEPIIIASLASVASEAFVLETVRRIQVAHLRDERFGNEFVFQVLKSLGPPIDLRQSLKGEIFLATGGLDYFNRPDIQEELQRSTGFRRTFVDMTQRAKVEAIVLREYRQLFTAWPKDPYDYLAIREVAKAPSREIDKALSEISNTFATGGGPAGDGLIGGQALTAATGLARRRLTRIFSECLGHFRKSASFPASLPLSGQDAIDPLTRKPFIYRLNPEGFLVYSVGQDLKDDGGIERQENRGPFQGFDIVVKYP